MDQYRYAARTSWIDRAAQAVLVIAAVVATALAGGSLLG